MTWDPSWIQKSENEFSASFGIDQSGVPWDLSVKWSDVPYVLSLHLTYITWHHMTFLDIFGFYDSSSMSHRHCTYVQDENHQEIQCVLELNIWDHFRLLYYPTRECCGYLSISIQNQLEKWLIVCQLQYNHPKI